MIKDSSNLHVWRVRTIMSHISGCCAKLQAFLVAVWRNSGTNAMKTLHISTSVGVARFQPSTDVTTRHPIGHSSPSISLQLVSSWLAMILAKEGPMTEVTEIWYLIVTFPVEMTRYWGFIPSIFRHKYHIQLVEVLSHTVSPVHIPYGSHYAKVLRHRFPEENNI